MLLFGYSFAKVRRRMKNVFVCLTSTLIWCKLWDRSLLNASKTRAEENAKWPARKINNKSRLVADKGNLSCIFICKRYFLIEDFSFPRNKSKVIGLDNFGKFVLILYI